MVNGIFNDELTGILKDETNPRNSEDTLDEMRLLEKLGAYFEIRPENIVLLFRQDMYIDCDAANWRKTPYTDIIWAGFTCYGKHDMKSNLEGYEKLRIKLGDSFSHNLAPEEINCFRTCLENITSLKKSNNLGSTPRFPSGEIKIHPLRYDNEKPCKYGVELFLKQI